MLVGSAADPFADVPPAYRTSEVELFYLTDRKRVETKDGSVRYGHERSPSLAVGTCTVEIGDDLSWEDLVRASRAKRRGKRLTRPWGGVEQPSCSELIDLV